MKTRTIYSLLTSFVLSLSAASAFADLAPIEPVEITTEATQLNDEVEILRERPDRPRPNPCAFFPDLTITEAKRPIRDDRTRGTEIVVEIRNQGAAAGPFVVRLSVWEIGYNTEIRVAALPANSSIGVLFRLPFWILDRASGYIAEIDSYKQVRECNERNNLRVWNNIR